MFLYVFERDLVCRSLTVLVLVLCPSDPRLRYDGESTGPSEKFLYVGVGGVCLIHRERDHEGGHGQDGQWCDVKYPGME